MNQNNAEMQKFILGGTVLAGIVMVLAVVGLLMAIVAVIGFVAVQWRDIFRYEGRKPVLWLLAITVIVAVPCAFWANQFVQMAARAPDKTAGMLKAWAFFTMLVPAAPTVLYWLYRKIKPVSHIRVAYIEHWHNAYRKGEITRIERGDNIRATIAQGDAALEKIHANAMRAKSQPAAQSNAAFDVPEQPQ